MSGCWLFAGHLDRDGYGRVTVRMDGKPYNRLVHRLVYGVFKGDIPAGMVADHKCKVRCCCNPDHIEPVTVSENQRRGDSGKASRDRALNRTSCPKGHKYGEVGIYWHSDGRRRCAECARNAQKRAKIRKVSE